MNQERVVQKIVHQVEQFLGDVVEDPENMEDVHEQAWTLAVDAATSLSLDDPAAWAKLAMRQMGYHREAIKPNVRGLAARLLEMLLQEVELDYGQDANGNWVVWREGPMGAIVIAGQNGELTRQMAEFMVEYGFEAPPTGHAEEEPVGFSRPGGHTGLQMAQRAKWGECGPDMAHPLERGKTEKTRLHGRWPKGIASKGKTAGPIKSPSNWKVGHAIKGA